MTARSRQLAIHAYSGYDPAVTLRQVLGIIKNGEGDLGDKLRKAFRDIIVFYATGGTEFKKVKGLDNESRSRMRTAATFFNLKEQLSTGSNKKTLTVARVAQTFAPLVLHARIVAMPYGIAGGEDQLPEVFKTFAGAHLCWMIDLESEHREWAKTHTREIGGEWKDDLYALTQKTTAIQHRAFRNPYFSIISRTFGEHAGSVQAKFSAKERMMEAFIIEDLLTVPQSSPHLLPAGAPVDDWI